MDWYNYGMGAVLLQSYDSVETIETQAQEKAGKNYEFEKYLEGINGATTGKVETHFLRISSRSKLV